MKEGNNSGDCNSGNCNSGNCNSGNHNSGYSNSGNCNSGDCNSGNRNSGYSNSGNYNSGDYNSGDYNSGNYNSGNFNSGFFNTDEPTIRMFNKDTNLKMEGIKIPYVFLKVTEWVSKDKMTDEQKNNYPKFNTEGGALITRSYKEAWKLYWSEASKEDKQLFLDLPNFCPKIFKEITGIEVNDNSCDGKIVEIEGKKYKLQEI